MKNALFSDKKFKFDASSNPNLSPVLSANTQNNSEEVIILDKEKINECFRIILQTTNESLRKEADNFLFHCEKNAMFYSFLLEIFDSTQVFIAFWFKNMFFIGFNYKIASTCFL